MFQSVDAAVGGNPVLPWDRSREIQSFRGLMIGIAVSALLWAPLGVVAMKLL